jgi:hypothetical protein
MAALWTDEAASLAARDVKGSSAKVSPSGGVCTEVGESAPPPLSCRLASACMMPPCCGDTSKGGQRGSGVLLHATVKAQPTKRRGHNRTTAEVATRRGDPTGREVRNGQREWTPLYSRVSYLTFSSPTPCARGPI